MQGAVYALRSIIISQRLLGTKEIAVFHHTGCGMLTFTTDYLRRIVKEAEPGNAAVAQAVDQMHFLEFSDLEKSVKEDVKFLEEHPLVLRDTIVTGWIYHVETGKVRFILCAYQIMSAAGSRQRLESPSGFDELPEQQEQAEKAALEKLMPLYPPSSGPVIAIDLDDVLSQTNQMVADWHNSQYGTNMDISMFYCLFENIICTGQFKDAHKTGHELVTKLSKAQVRDADGEVFLETNLMINPQICVDLKAVLLIDDSIENALQCATYKEPTQVLLFGNYEWNKRLSGPQDAKDEMTFDQRLEAEGGKEFWKDEGIIIPEGAPLTRTKDWSEVLANVRIPGPINNDFDFADRLYIPVAVESFDLPLKIRISLNKKIEDFNDASMAKIVLMCDTPAPRPDDPPLKAPYLYSGEEVSALVKSPEHCEIVGPLHPSLMAQVVTLRTQSKETQAEQAPPGIVPTQGTPTGPLIGLRTGSMASFSALHAKSFNERLTKFAKVYVAHRPLVQRVLNISFVVYVLATAYYGLSSRTSSSSSTGGKSKDMANKGDKQDGAGKPPRVANKLAIAYRTRLTKEVMKQYLGQEAEGHDGKVYYKISNLDDRIKNPDQLRSLSILDSKPKSLPFTLEG
ncbi:hypothetical protein C0995_014155 [Termitomyces sp. Mi166|nr:hypothetical protein C0995_014155 [Termitomyces sp. Mi166\